MSIKNNSADKDILKPLVEETIEWASKPLQAFKKQLWADHQSLKKTARIPITVYYEGIPGQQWKFMLGEGYQRCKSDLARRIEYDLRRRLWIADNVRDDHIVWPAVTVPAVIRSNISWGLEFGYEGTEHANDPLGAKRIKPAFEDEIDIDKLAFTDCELDEKATALAVREANELVGGLLDVHVEYPNMGYGPFDIAVAMRGMERIMMDVIDQPQAVTDLMEYITSSLERHHLNRRENGLVNCHCSRDLKYMMFGFRVHCAYTNDDFNPKESRLSDEWAYVTAQTSAGLGPEMFAQFVHPYNCRLASFFDKQTVYYHGCECLDRKLDVLASLPNLRRFHVSPWSSVKAAVEKFQGSVVIEAHAHPGKVFFGATPDDMKREVQNIVDVSGGVPIDINLSDIHSINDNPSLLTQWAEAASEVAEKGI